MYNEKDDQIFIRLNNAEEPTEFLLDYQPMAMIASGYITKNQVRETVETGLELESERRKKAFVTHHPELVMTVDVRIDVVLRIIDEVKMLVF